MAAVKQGTIDTATAYVLGNGDQTAVSRWVIQGVASGWTGSLTVKGRVFGSGAAYTAIGYINRATDAVATAAITASFLIEVNCSGLDIELDVTASSAGSVAYYAIPVLG